ncbi:MAG TPA: hypothetical protein VL461_01850 [Dictyobacter sp.]|jgi:hypothetical protein|nr:hypothetical protein [Dictyobacter sp.]
MDEKTSSSSVSAEPKSSTSMKEVAAAVQKSDSSTERTASEHRQAYGTAKTENLRDSGLWRLVTPVVVILFCLALLIIPLLILGPLLYNSVSAIGTNNQQETQLIWLWITMIVLEIIIWLIIVRGLIKVFMTQTVNYRQAR